MASLAAVSLKNPIIPIVSSFDPATVRTVKVENRWTTGGANPREEYAKMFLPVCDDPSNKELFLYVVDQFFDAMHNERLHLSRGEQRYTKFRAVLGGALRLSWTTISDAQAAKTNDTFASDVAELIGQYLAPSSFADQDEYLKSVTKPFNVSCEELGSRLRVINRLSIYLPGSQGAVLYDDGVPIKRAYFRMMLESWKVKFAENGHNLDADDYTYTDLVRFMAIQETISKGKRKAEASRGGRGRGGHGGRGGGRFGRGRGRGPGGRYQYRPPGGYSAGTFGGGQYVGGQQQPVPGVATRSAANIPPRTTRSSTGRSPAARGRGPPPGRGGRGYAPRYPPYSQRPGPQGGYRPSGYYYYEEPYYYDDHYYQDDTYYEEPYTYDDQYYQESNFDEQYNEQYDGTSEQYYQEPRTQGQQRQQDEYLTSSGTHTEPETPNTEQEDVHWFDEFGY